MPDVRSQVSAGWQKWRQTTGVLCDKKVPVHLKAKIYKTVVRPAALYGTECWPTARKHEQSLHVMEMKMLRWMQGLTRLDHVTNYDIRQRLSITAIEKKMREVRLRWYGHVMRKEPKSVVRTALNLEPGGRRPRGRPKKRWMDTIQNDLHATNLTPEDASNRAAWRRRIHC